MTALLQRALICLLALACCPAFAQDRLTLGVFAFRPKPVMIERYTPIADYLSSKLGGVRVELAVLEQDELQEAVAARRIDLLMTNPSHYLELRSHNSLSGALATVISMENGQAVASLGGCIIVSSARTDISGLRALEGRRIAIPGPRFLGGYQAQAYELKQAGVRVPDDVELLVAGSHEAVVQAVLEGR
ncbi:MAG: phosphate/phosphite/phosphonate ABC transporter substrate-binding protein, partial [Thauera sp.]